jgi:MFS family permease
MSETTTTAPRGSLWRSAGFRRLWLAQTAPLAGAAVSTLALPLVAVLSLHASPFTVGLLAAMAYLPFLVLGLPVGVWIDGRLRRPLLVAGDVVRVLAWASIPLASALGTLTLGHLLVVGAVLGIVNVVTNIAGQALLPDLLGDDRLVEANAKLAIGETASDVAGPIAAGLVISWTSAPAALAVAAVTALCSLVALRRLRVEERIEVAKATRSTGAVAEGWRLMFGDQLLSRFALWAAVYNGAQGVVTAVLLIFMTRHLGFSAALTGALFAVASATALLGSLLIDRHAETARVGPVLVLSAAVAAFSYVLLPLVPSDGGTLAIVLVGAALAIDEAASIVCVVLVQSVRIDPSVMGRVMASARFLTMGAIPLGTLAGGVLAELVGVRTTLAIGSGLMLLSVPIIASGEVLRLRSLPARRVGVRAGSAA